ncbi:MAG: hypothetical protein LUI13_04810 [Lachnospiraceae bacterium]|nr:hypothetical protein [Lachnospiraceae bacterium]
MRRIKKMLLPFLLSMVIAVLYGTVSMADAGTAAQIGETGYASLEAAVAAVQSGETIVLQEDLAYAEVVSVNRSGISFTLDLNGHTLQFTGSNAYLHIKNGTVTVKNGTISNSTDSILKIASAATVKITSGTYTGMTTNAGKLTVSGGTFNIAETALALEDGTNDLYYYAKAIFTNTGTLKISKGTFTTPTCRILTNSGTTTISSGTFKCTYDGFDEQGQLVNIKKGKLTIKGGTFSAKCAVLSAADSSSTVISGKTTFKTTASYALILVTEKAKVKIKKGSFKLSGKNSYSSVILSYSKGTVSISGGTFTSGGTLVRMGGSGKVNISGGTFKTTKKYPMLIAQKSTIKVSGGKFTASKGYSYQLDGGKVSIGSGASVKSKYGVYKG